MDPEAFHWVILDNNKVIAAARIAVVNSINEINEIEPIILDPIPGSKSYAYFSRLVVDTKYRNSGLAKLLDEIRCQFIKNTKLPVSIAIARYWRIKQLNSYGFEQLGPVRKKLNSNCEGIPGKIFDKFQMYILIMSDK